MDKSAQHGRLVCNKITWSVILRSALLFVLLLYLLFNFIVCEYASKPSPATTRFHEIHATKQSSPAKTTIARNSTEPCRGRYIYVHNLPPRFNEDMLKECNKLSIWTDMCKFVSNSGLGLVLENTSGVFSNTSWYGTNQFSVDVIFANRMKKYECLTNDSSMASAIFVPFYAGFDIARHLWGFDISVRDKLAIDLVNLLVKTPEWSIMGGKDHFLVGGRITWDFRRLTEDDSDWGNKLLLLPAAKNMSMLVVESSPWHKNDFAIPYPSYFHPADDMDVFSWQKRMRERKRPWLFSFVGAPRVNDSKSIRDHIIHECRRSKVCKLLECDFGPTKCYSPDGIMKVFQESRFCLQPVGDSYTRRSAFDAMLAGCIPVFFHPGSAYTQYKWHLPRNYSKYSVFIPENEVHDKNTSIEKILLEISRENVVNMREEVLRLIPRFTYADPRSKLAAHKDAFDVAVEGVIERVGKLRKEMTKGCSDGSCEEDHSSHEWDSFFT